MLPINKKYIKEIKVISDSTKRRPYASKINFELPDGLDYGFDGECSLLINGSFIIRIIPDTNNEKNSITKQKHTAIIEGFATAGHAENMGLKLSMALLWAAVSKKWPLKLDYHTPQPCMVFDRTKTGGGGISISCQMSASMKANASSVSGLINEIMSKSMELDPRLLISMELFASARLESTERAKFIGLVSSLEPLAVQKAYENVEIENLVDSFAKQLSQIKTLPEKTIDSIKGRAFSLKKESISQAILRYVQNFFPNQPEILKIVKDAYDIRSSILHNGTFDADLEEKGNSIEDIVRFIYSKILGVDL